MILIYWTEAYILCIKKNVETLVVVGKENGPKVNADTTKYMVISQDQNTRCSHNIKTDNNSFERVEQFKYLGTILMNQNSIQEEIKSRVMLGNASVFQFTIHKHKD